MESTLPGGGPRVLVTGITGQDGGYLAERLAERGAQIHGLVRGDDAATDDLLARTPGVRLHEGDLGDPESTAALIRRIAPEAIYNLGGISSVAQSWVDPLLTARANALTVAAMLHAAWDLTAAGEPVRFLQASSAEIFGNPTVRVQDETTPISPVTPYGAAKAYAHHLVKVYRDRGMHAGAVILYNHESPRRPTQFVTRKITSAAARIAAGDDEPLLLGNLDARRDWGWAPDYVDAMVRAVGHDEPDDYVVATGVSHSVRDFVAAAFGAAGVADWEQYVRVDPAFFRPVDAVELTGDATRARSTLGWEPTVPFEELVRRMVQVDLHDEQGPADEKEQR